MNEARRPTTEFTSKLLKQPEEPWKKGGLTHEQLVQGARSHIRKIQAIEIDILNSNKVRSPEAILHSRLLMEWHHGRPKDPVRTSFFENLTLAWDAIAFDRYPFLSQESSVAAYVLEGYSTQTGGRTIALPYPEQVQILDAFAEAADIPHKPGRTEIPIPDNVFRRNEIGAQLLEEEERRKPIR